MVKHLEISTDDVLNAFAMDFAPGTGTLQRYLALYPQYAIALVDLSRELSREINDEAPSEVELALVRSQMSRLRGSFASLGSLQAAPAQQFIAAAAAHSLPMYVAMALRDRRIQVASVPKRLLTSLAAELHASVETLVSFLELPPQVTSLRYRKSNVKPTAPEKVSLEQVLREAGVTEQIVSDLLHNE